MQLIQKPEFAETIPDAVDARFAKAATKLDGKIQATIDKVGRDMTALGEMFLEVKDKGYHVAMGFPVFADYVKARFPGTSKTQVFEAMRVVRELTSGDNPVASSEDIRGMSQDNATVLAQLKKKKVPITPELIEQAKTMPAAQFKSDVAYVASPDLAQATAVRQGRPLAGGVEISVTRKYTMTTEVAAQMERCAEIAKYVTRDSDQQESFVDRWLGSMCAEYEATYRAEYEEFIAAAEAEGAAAGAAEKDNIRITPEEMDEEDEAILADVGVVCQACSGSGERAENSELPCEVCDGDGYVQVEEESLQEVIA